MRPFQSRLTKISNRLSSSSLSTPSSSAFLPSSTSISFQNRSYAVLVNKSSSVDSSFGNSPPPAPNQDPHSPSPSLRLRTPIGAQVRGDPFPNRDPINRDTPPSSWGRGLGGRPPSPPSTRPSAINLSNQSSTQDSLGDREHPHTASISDQDGNTNSLDSKILKAAEALLRQQLSASTSTNPNHSDNHDDIPAPPPSDLHQLLESFSKLANHQLPFSLPYEPTPAKERKVPLTNARSTPSEIESAKDDGVVLVAYVDGLDITQSLDASKKQREPKISVCSGFAVEGKKMLPDKGKRKGELLITCAHTLQSCMPSSSKSSPSSTQSQSSPSSLGLVMTRTGLVYRIHSLLSSLPTSDLVLLQLSEAPISIDGQDQTSKLPELRTLPLSPYPSPVGTELCVSSFSGWENDSAAEAMGKAAAAFSQSSSSSAASSSSEAEERARARGRWGRARLVEYKDPSGREAKTGTYDELSQLEFKVLTNSEANLPSSVSSGSFMSSERSSSIQQSSSNHDQVGTTSRSNLPLFSTLSNFPPPGSSGGPVVESSSGAVVGIVRGSKMSALEGRRGDAIPAEKAFEFFALPGMGNNKV